MRGCHRSMGIAPTMGEERKGGHGESINNKEKRCITSIGRESTCKGRKGKVGAMKGTALGRKRYNFGHDSIDRAPVMERKKGDVRHSPGEERVQYQTTWLHT